MGLYEIQLYELLCTKLGEKEANALVKQLENRFDRNFIDPKNLLAQKEDIAMLKADIVNAKIELLRWMLVIFVTLVLAILGLYITVV